MPISVYRLLLITISTVVVTDRIIRFLKKEERQSLFKLISTLVIWLPILAIGIDTGVVYSINKIFGLGENLNSLIFTALIIIFILLFKLLSLIENLERNITKIVRKEALKDIKNSRDQRYD